MTKNANLRQEEYREHKKKRAEERRDRKRRRETGEDVELRKPRTIEDMRAPCDSLVPQFDEELLAEEAVDEFAEANETETREPKIMIVTGEEHPGKRTITFLKEFVEVIPNLTFFKRKTFPIKKIVEIAKSREFTSLVVIQEHAGQPDSLLVISLPEGPTATFKLTGLQLGSELRLNTPCNSEAKPEVVLRGFTTRLGHRIARQFKSLFPAKCDEEGRRVVALHNQRDFIFFRHYRFAFKDIDVHPDDLDQSTTPNNTGARCALQEIGPRFTLKLHALQLGTFDKKHAEYEFLWRPDSQVDRKNFAL